MTPSRTALKAIVERCGLTLGPGQYDQLWAYHRLLRAANARLNLTRIHRFENIVLKHYVDSLLVLRFVEPPAPLIDMGSGPGLPGIPLKIARPGLPMILAEPRGARAAFLEEVVSQLGLRDVEVVASKVGPRFPHRARGIVTRAVASVPETLDLVADVLEPGGRMIFMKGPGCGPEVDEAARAHASTFRLVQDDAYRIPHTTHERRLLVYERSERPSPSRARRPESTADAVGGPGADSDLAASSRSASPARETSITSAANPAFKLWRELLTGRGIRKHGLALMSGARAVGEILGTTPERAEAWITGPDGPPPATTGPGTSTSPAVEPAWHRLSGPLFRELDTAGTHAPLLLVRVPEMEEWSGQTPWPEGCTLFVPFQDPENVGAVIRSAAAFEVARVVLLRECAHPFHPRSQRAAGPTLFRVPLLRGPSIADLSTSDVPLIALATDDGPEIGSEPFPERFGLVPGVEGPGLPPALRDGPRRRIAIAAGVESLNAATATAIALYAWRQGRRA